jgi:transposase
MTIRFSAKRLRRRAPWTEDEARATIEAWSSSGESLAGFARRHGLGSERIRWWQRRLVVGEQRGRDSVALVPVTVVGGAAPAIFEVVVGDLVVRVPAEFDAAALRRLLDALSAC